MGFFALFILWTIGFVVFSGFHRVELVADDYYEQELKYQAEIERLQRARALTVSPSVRYDAARRSIVVTLPGDQARLNPTGSIHLFRPSASRFDQSVALEIAPDGVQHIDASRLPGGLWRARLTWTTAGQTFRHDQEVVIPPAGSAGSGAGDPRPRS